MREEGGSNMDFAALLPLIPVVAVLSGIVLGWMGRARTINQDVEQRVRLTLHNRRTWIISNAGWTTFDSNRKHKGNELMS